MTHPLRRSVLGLGLAIAWVGLALLCSWMAVVVVAFAIGDAGGHAPHPERLRVLTWWFYPLAIGPAVGLFIAAIRRGRRVFDGLLGYHARLVR